MNRTYILYNPTAGHGGYADYIDALALEYENPERIDMQKISSYETFLSTLEEGDAVIICGGDGTLNRFINDTRGVELKNDIYYFACGSGNDFARELGYGRGTLVKEPINQYLKDLPRVLVKGKEYLVLNGVGYGIDGYCCEIGDELHEKNKREGTKKKINYTAIAIKGLLFHYKPKKATVTVDGKEYKFDRVWLSPTMNGKYYGGGMIPAPEQKRLAEDKKISVMVYHNAGKLKALLIFPSIFKGEHVKHTECITVLEGKEITVRYDSPAPLQIDGETILDVPEYTMYAK